MDDAEDRPATAPADAFGALSDPLRIDVLQALATHHRETGTAAPLGFADLRRQVGVYDYGRFRYHLEQLRGKFVERADEGYRLTYAGVEVVAAILMGAYTEELTIGPEELDSECLACGEPAVATYENGICRVVALTNTRFFSGVCHRTLLRTLCFRRSSS